MNRYFPVANLDEIRTIGKMGRKNDLVTSLGLEKTTSFIRPFRLDLLLRLLQLAQYLAEPCGAKLQGELLPSAFAWVAAGLPREPKTLLHKPSGQPALPSRVN